MKKTAPQICVFSGKQVIPDVNGVNTNIGPVHNDSSYEYKTMMNAIWLGMHAEECSNCKASRKIAGMCIEQGVSVADAIGQYREQVKNNK